MGELFRALKTTSKMLGHSGFFGDAAFETELSDIIADKLMDEVLDRLEEREKKASTGDMPSVEDIL